MKKKTTVLLALISMCLIVTAGIGAVSASDEPVVSVTVGKINPDGTTTVVKTVEGSGPMVVTAIENEDGSVNITKEDRELSEEELNVPNVYKEITITPETKLPVTIEDEKGSITADNLNPSERIDASVRTLYYKACAWNYVTGDSCCAYSYNYCYGASAKAWDGSTQCGLWYWC